MKFHYTFYVNTTEDEAGRRIAMMDGFNTHARLQIGHSGWLDMPNFNHRLTRPELYELADVLFTKFNIEHPSDYRGPSMSRGDVISIQGEHLAVASVGFQRVEIFGCLIEPGNPRWIGGNSR